MDYKQKIIYNERRFLYKDCEKLVNYIFNNIKYNKLDFNVVPVEEKCGYFGDHYRILIEIIAKDTITDIYCFAKCIPKPESGIDLDLAIGAFKKEVFIYEYLFRKISTSGISLLKTIVPECVFTKLNCLLIFEDLSKTGFKPLTRYDFLNYDHVEIIIKSLAKLHSSSLIFEDKLGTNLGNLFSKYDETFYSEKEGHKGTKSLYAALKGLYTEIEVFKFDCGSMTKDDFKRKLNMLCHQMMQLVKPSKKQQNVICHGDLWQTNFMMRYDRNKPSQCVIIDFQTARYCPPAHDVIAFLFLTTSRIFRKRHITELIDLYYNEMFKNLHSYGINLTNIIPYKEFLDSCEEQKLFGALQAATYFQLTHVKSESIAKLSKDKKLWEDALYEDHSILILDNLHDLDYKYRLHESLKDLRDLVENKNI